MPINKLSELGMRAATARALADNLRSADVSALAQWLAGGGVGDRPARSAEMVLCDYNAVEAERDAEAASALIPKLEAEAAQMDPPLAWPRIAAMCSSWRRCSRRPKR
jgi:hypothetical protein